MAYIEGNLSPTDTTSLPWALAWVRFLLRDTTSPETFSDLEVEAVVKAKAWTFTPAGGTATTYYRPHSAAASLVEADPDRAVNESTLGATFQTRPPASIARSIRRSGRWVDDAIEDAAGRRPASNLMLTARF